MAADFFPVVSTPAPVTQPPAPPPPPQQPPQQQQQPPPLPVLKNSNQNEHESLPCNCPPWKQREGLCPLAGQCRQTNIIYGASIKTRDILGEPVQESEETYTGTSYPIWKTRYYRHNTTFNNPALRHHTTLVDYTVTRICRVCLKESFLILFHPETASLSKHFEGSCKLLR